MRISTLCILVLTFLLISSPFTSAINLRNDNQLSMENEHHRCALFGTNMPTLEHCEHCCSKECTRSVKYHKEVLKCSE